MEKLKASIGMLLCSGWTLDDILDMSLEQIGFVIESSMLYKAEVANYVMESISTALGGKVKGKSRLKDNKTGIRQNSDGTVDVSASKLSESELDAALKGLGLM